MVTSTAAGLRTGRTHRLMPFETQAVLRVLGQGLYSRQTDSFLRLEDCEIEFESLRHATQRYEDPLRKGLSSAVDDPTGLLQADVWSLQEFGGLDSFL